MIVVLWEMYLLSCVVGGCGDFDVVGAFCCDKGCALILDGRADEL